MVFFTAQSVHYPDCQQLVIWLPQTARAFRVASDASFPRLDELAVFDTNVLRILLRRGTAFPLAEVIPTAP